METDKANKAILLSHLIAPIFVDKDESEVGGALADLVSMWLVGYHPDNRVENLDMFVKTVWKLVPISEEQAFGGKGYPDGD